MRGHAGKPPRDVLDAALHALHRGEVRAALDALAADLALLRRSGTPEAWDAAIREARAHELREVLHRDPFTYRCYAKPRGYCPDGPALDYVLRARHLAVPSADLVARLHQWATRGQAARALHFRRDSIAREVEACAGRTPQPARVLAAGASSLRECDRIGGFALGRIARLVAFDADAQNLEAARRDYPALPIVPHHGSVRELVDGPRAFGDMDLVWCSGLLETLPDPAAAGLVRGLFDMLAPGGTLVLTQFLPTLGEAAFLEAYMDWKMAYRGQAGIFSLVRELPDDMARAWTYSENAESTMGLVTVRRR